MSIDNNIDFKDHIVEYPNRFKMTNVSPGVVELVPTWIETPSEIIQPGTPVDEELFEKLKQNITIYQQTFTTTNNQTVINLNRHFLVGQNRVSLTIGGVKQYSGQDYTETATNQLTMTTPQRGGLKAEAIIFTASQAIAEDLFDQVTAALTATQAASTAAAGANAAKETAYTVQLTPVANFAAIATTYPSALNGSEVQTLDDGKIYRKENGTWVYRKSLTPGPVADLLNKLELQKQFVNVKEYNAVADGVTDDRPAIMAAVAAAAVGGTVYFPPGQYYLSSSLYLQKSVNLKGVKPRWTGTDLTDGTVIRQKIYLINVKNITVEGMGVINTGDNGIEIAGPASDIRIKNCRMSARDHCFLAQSYAGLVTNILVDDCDGHKGIHGFISKASNVEFRNCRADGGIDMAFGFVSDNIPQIGWVGNAINNKAIGCTSTGYANAYKAYSRDYFDANNGSGVILKDLIIENCKSINASNLALTFGDASLTAGVATNKVFNIKVKNFTSENTTNAGMYIGRIEDAVFDACKLDKVITYTNVPENIKKIRFTNHMGLEREVQTITTGNPLYNGVTKVYELAHTAATEINGMLGRIEDSAEVLLLFTTDKAYINNGSAWNLKRSRYQGIGTWIKVRYENGKWNEIESFNAAQKAITRNFVTDASAFDLARATVHDVAGTGTTTNKITTTGNPIEHEQITFIVRSTGGTFAYGGFDSAKFSIPSGFPTSVAFGSAHVSTWVFFQGGINKWICITDRISPYT